MASTASSFAASAPRSGSPIRQQRSGVKADPEIALPGNGQPDARSVVEPKWTRPTPEGFLHVCCDCGLAHSVDFRVNKKTGLAEYRMYQTEDSRKLTQIGRQHNNELDASALLELREYEKAPH